MIALPASQDGIALADWLEASLLTQGEHRISDTAIMDVLSEADLPDSDAMLEIMVQTVRSRHRIIGENYPVRRDGSGFTRLAQWRRNVPYGFMLFTSLNQSYEELTYRRGTANRPAELFEALASRALENYLNCSVIRIGAPRRQPVPAPFPKALDYVVRELGEAIGQRDLEDHDSGDDGVDLIGWRRFGDARASQAIILAQCTIDSDWRRKRDGISLELWRRHIDWHSRPLKAFAVPFHHEAGRAWRETATRAGIVFDRLRIARLVEPAALRADTRRAMTDWCEQRSRAILKLTI